MQAESPSFSDVAFRLILSMRSIRQASSMSLLIWMDASPKMGCFSDQVLPQAVQVNLTYSTSSMRGCASHRRMPDLAPMPALDPALAPAMRACPVMLDQVEICHMVAIAQAGLRHRIPRIDPEHLVRRLDAPWFPSPLAHGASTTSVIALQVRFLRHIVSFRSADDVGCHRGEEVLATPSPPCSQTGTDGSAHPRPSKSASMPAHQMVGATHAIATRKSFEFGGAMQSCKISWEEPPEWPI